MSTELGNADVQEGDVVSPKIAIILGVTNKDSIAYGTAVVMHEAGIKVICTTLPMLVSRAKDALGPDFEVMECDVSIGESAIVELVEKIEAAYGYVDFVVHSMAGSDPEELKGLMVGKPPSRIPDFETLKPKEQKALMGVSRENVRNSIIVGAHSFLEVARHFHPIMRPGGGFIAYSFAGSQFYSPHYNVMGPVKAALESYNRGIAAELGEYGITSNIVLSGPVRTMSTGRIGSFVTSLFMSIMRSATGKNVTQRQVGEATLNILLSRAITGEAINVDNGVRTLVGMGATLREVAMNNEKRQALIAEAKAKGSTEDEAEAAV